MGQTIATYTDETYNLKFEVHAVKGGFSVTMIDVDAEATFPAAIIYPTVEAAKAKALRLSQGKA